MREVLSEEQLATGLRKYISKNRLIADFFQQVEANRSAFEWTFAKIKIIIAAGNYREFCRLISEFDYSDLLEKLKTSDYQANGDIAWDVSLHLLYLIEKQEIPFWQGMTFYNYAVALIEYSADSNVELSEPVTLTENNQFSAQGMAFIEDLIEGYQSEYNIDVNQEALLSFILSLPQSEQTIFKVGFKSLPNPSDTFSQQNDRVEFSRQIYSRMVYHKRQHKDDRRGITPFEQPSFGLLNYLLSLMGSQPMQMLPLLGRIGLGTLHLLHEKDQHMVALYSPYVRNNYDVVHEFKAGKWLVGQHDIGHTFWASVMQADFRAWMQAVLIPAYRKCINDIAALSLPEKSYLPAFIEESLESYIDALQDYEVAPAYKYVKSRPEETFAQYLLKIVRHIGINFSRGLYAGVKLEDLNGKDDLVDDIIFLILTKILSETLAGDKLAVQLATIKELLIAGINNTKRNPEIVNRLITLVNGQSFAAENEIALQQPERLLKIFKWAAKGGMHEKAAWRRFKEHPDFDRLIVESNLKWYSPYMPLKPEECTAVIGFIKPQIKTYSDVMQELKEVSQSSVWMHFFPHSQSMLSNVCNEESSSYRL